MRKTDQGQGDPAFSCCGVLRSVPFDFQGFLASVGNSMRHGLQHVERLRRSATMLGGNMKRDMDLVRLILLEIEQKSVMPDEEIENFAVPNYSDKIVGYHVWMLAQAGFIEALELSMDDAFLCLPRCLTWRGHEFLDSIRDEEIWRKTKAGAARVGGFSVDILTALAKGFIRQKAGEYLGIAIP